MYSVLPSVDAFLLKLLNRELKVQLSVVKTTGVLHVVQALHSPPVATASEE